MARELADGLISSGHRVRLITSHPGLPSRTNEDGLEVVRLWRPPDGRLRRRLYESYLTHAPFSYLALYSRDDDIAHALYPPDAIVAARWARHRGAAAVFSYMGIPERSYLVARRGRLDAIVAACRDADRVVALSTAAADAFWNTLGVRAQVIRPGVDVSHFTPGGEKAPQPTIFCNASFEVAHKRVDMLVRALPLVRRSRPDARLVLFRPRDAALAQRLERECDGVELISAEPGQDDALLLDSYRCSWITALPSRGEAFGLVLAESLACGTPVVGTRSGGMPEIIDRGEVGRLFDGDEAALAEALLETLEIAEQPATAAACRERALELSSARMTAAYEELYRELAG
jgi:glycosyltransferase involved in cell wall biosynthesis